MSKILSLTIQWLLHIISNMGHFGQCSIWPCNHLKVDYRWASPPSGVLMPSYTSDWLLGVVIHWNCPTWLDGNTMDGWRGSLQAHCPNKRSAWITEEVKLDLLSFLTSFSVFHASYQCKARHFSVIISCFYFMYCLKGRKQWLTFFFCKTYVLSFGWISCLPWIMQLSLVCGRRLSLPKDLLPLEP